MTEKKVSEIVTIKVTREQMDTLLNGGEVNGQTYNDDVVYLVEKEDNDIVEIPISGDLPTEGNRTLTKDEALLIANNIDKIKYGNLVFVMDNGSENMYYRPIFIGIDIHNVDYDRYSFEFHTQGYRYTLTLFVYKNGYDDLYGSSASGCLSKDDKQTFYHVIRLSSISSNLNCYFNYMSSKPNPFTTKDALISDIYLNAFRTIDKAIPTNGVYGTGTDNAVHAIYANTSSQLSFLVGSGQNYMNGPASFTITDTVKML